MKKLFTLKSIPNLFQIYSKSKVLFLLAMSFFNLTLFVQAQTYKTAVPTVIENVGQLKNTSNIAAENIKYYGNAGNELFFWNKSHDFILSKYYTDTAKNQIELFRVDLSFLNKSSKATYQPIEYNHYLNYYIDDFSKAKKNVSVYKALKIVDLYDSINLLQFVSTSNNLIFECLPNSNPSQIKFNALGSNNNSVNAKGGFTFSTSMGDITSDSISAYQSIKGKITSIPLQLKYNGTFYSFTISSYDMNEPLYIYMGTQSSSMISGNFALSWSTFYGGDFYDFITDLQITDGDTIFTCGASASLIFPVILGSNIFQSIYGNYMDAFLVKFNPDRSISWGTYFGGTGSEFASQIAITYYGDVYMVGRSSGNTPICNTCQGFLQTSLQGNDDGFIARFKWDGNIDPLSNGMATYFGGDGLDRIASVTLNAVGDVYISGTAGSGSQFNFPYKVKAGAYDQKINPSIIIGGISEDGFIARFDDQNNLLWSTAIGGYNESPKYGGPFSNELITGLRCSKEGSVYATGYTSDEGRINNTIWNSLNTTGSFPLVQLNSTDFCKTNSGWKDAILMKINDNGAIVWSTEIGGHDEENFTSNFNIPSRLLVLTDKNEVILGGNTFSYLQGNPSTDFPLENYNLPNGYNEHRLNLGLNDIELDGFLLKFSDTKQLIWSTFTGGSSRDEVTAISIGNTKKLVVGGVTSSTDLPTKSLTGTYFQSSLNGGNTDGLMGMFSESTLDYHYSSYFGGEGDDRVQGIDIRSISNSPVLEEFVIGGVSSSNVIFPFADLPGSIDYYTTSQGSYASAFVSTFQNICIPCLKLPNQNSNYNTTFNTFNDSYEIQMDLKGIYKISFYDLLGRKYYTELINSSRINILKQNLNSGLNLISITSETGKVTSVKLIGE